MMNLNSVILSGRLVRDVELKHLPGGTEVAEGTIAFNTWNGKESIPNYIRFGAFSKTAEIMKDLKKGQSLTIEGGLKFNSWEDKTGGKRSEIKLSVHRVHYDKLKENGYDGATQRQYTPSVSQPESYHKQNRERADQELYDIGEPPF